MTETLLIIAITLAGGISIGMIIQKKRSDKDRAEVIVNGHLLGLEGELPTISVRGRIDFNMTGTIEKPVPFELNKHEDGGIDLAGDIKDES